MAFTNDIAYRYGLQSTYDALISRDPQTLYWCTDTRKLYRGDDDYTEAVRFTDDHTSLLTPARNVLYVEYTGAGWVYVKDVESGSDVWKQIFGSDDESGITIVTVIDETSTDDVVPSAKAVYDLFQTLDVSDLDLSGYAKTEEVDNKLQNYALKSDIKNIADQMEYEVFDKPVGTLVDYRDKEIRILCPSTTKWVLRTSGENSDSSMYYLGFKAYAPNADVVSFKEDLKETIEDEEMYYFENNDFAGIDAYGRKYSIVWLPVANYDLTSDTWTYYGSMSTEDKYIGWYYRVDWYNADGIVIASDMIRINLSNEECHYAISDAVMTNFVTEDEVEVISTRVDELEDRLIDVSTWAEM